MGAYICVVNSSTVASQDEDFDGFRYARKRQGHLETQPVCRESPQVPELKARQTWYSSTDRSHVTFGHGQYACPGRFVAAVEMKLIFAALIMRYDMSFNSKKDNRGQAGQQRPQNLHVLELGFRNPSVRVNVRKRG